MFDIDIDLFKVNFCWIGKFEKLFVVIVFCDDGVLCLLCWFVGGVDWFGVFVNDEELVELGVIVIDLIDLNVILIISYSKFVEFV